jgi:hypothetical protein
MMKSRTVGDSFSYLVALRTSASFFKKRDLAYLLKHRVLAHVYKSSGSTSKFFDAMNKAVTAVSCRSFVGIDFGCLS